MWKAKQPAGSPQLRLAELYWSYCDALRLSDERASLTVDEPGEIADPYTFDAREQRDLSCFELGRHSIGCHPRAHQVLRHFHVQDGYYIATFVSNPVDIGDQQQFFRAKSRC